LTFRATFFSKGALPVRKAQAYKVKKVIIGSTNHPARSLRREIRGNTEKVVKWGSQNALWTEFKSHRTKSFSKALYPSALANHQKRAFIRLLK
jgi:hypothetical protein